MSFFKFGYLLSFNGAPKACEESSGARVLSESMRVFFSSSTLGSKIKHEMLFSCNYLSSSAAVVAFETKSLAPMPETPILVTYASDCCEGRVLMRKLSEDVRLSEVKPLINPYPW